MTATTHTTVPTPLCNRVHQMAAPATVLFCRKFNTWHDLRHVPVGPTVTSMSALTMHARSPRHTPRLQTINVILWLFLQPQLLPSCVVGQGSDSPLCHHEAVLVSKLIFKVELTA